VGNPQHIKLNGNLYDPATGRQLNPKDQQKENNPNMEARSHQAIDGIIGPKRGFNHHIKKVIQNAHTSNESQKIEHKIAPNASRPAQHSRTLMRQSVKKPRPINDTFPNNKTQISHRDKLREQFSNIADSTPIIKQTVAHANAIPRHKFVTRFGENVARPHQAIKQAIAAEPQPVDIHSKRLEQLAHQEKQIEKPSDIDDYTLNALKRADAFKEIDQKKKPFYAKAADKLNVKTRTFFILVSVVVLLIVVGGALYGFKNNIAFYIAERKIGLNSHLPNYTLPGFSVASIKAIDEGTASATLLVRYQSNSDVRDYEIVERSSKWDSETLLNAVVIPSTNDGYKTTDVSGRTLYTFSTDTEWVDGGVYYTLINNADLTTDQIAQIVNGA
jgi:hypothetical protein